MQQHNYEVRTYPGKYFLCKLLDFIIDSYDTGMHS